MMISSSPLYDDTKGLRENLKTRYGDEECPMEAKGLAERPDDDRHA
jgi:hypothetical protein